jgi:hypothetical protein
MIGGEVGFNQIVVLLALTAAESLRRLKTTFSSGGRATAEAPDSA